MERVTTIITKSVLKQVKEVKRSEHEGFFKTIGEYISRVFKGDRVQSAAKEKYAAAIQKFHQA